MKIFQFGFAMLATALFAVPASAVLIAYEGFDYQAGTDLDTGTVNGGTGWGNAWTRRGSNGGADKAVVLAGGLGYTDANGNVLYVTGNHAIVDHNTVSNTDDADGTGSGNAQYFRNVNFSALGDGTATTLGGLVGENNSYYLSFIGERQGASDRQVDPIGDAPFDPNEFARNAHLSLTTSTGNEEAQLGNPSNQTTDTWKIRAKDTPDADSGAQFSFNQSFVVAKVTVGDNVTTTDTIEMWIDPILTSEGLAGAPDAVKMVFDGGNPFNIAQAGLGMFIGNQGGGRAGAVMAFDELRIGTTWESVTPHNIPEPGTLALVGVGGIVAVAAFRRRR